MANGELVAEAAQAGPSIATLAGLRQADGAKVLGANLYKNPAGFDALLEQHGELAIRAIKSVLTRAMIDGAKIASIRSWRYFAPVIEQERKADIVASSIAQANPSLCMRCELRPRAAQGQLSRCLPCIREAAEEDRATRQAIEAALAAKRETKSCRTCGRQKPFVEFARHRLARDQHRHDCKSCVAAGRNSRAKPLTTEQREIDRVRRTQLHRRAANLQSVVAWQQRNPDAVAAHNITRQAIRLGALLVAKTCQAVGCRIRSGLASHHNHYGLRQRKKIIRLCAQHHRIVHSGRSVLLKPGACYRRARAPATA